MKKTIIAAIAVLFGALTVANAQENVQVSVQDTVMSVQDTLVDAQDTIIPIKPFFVTVYGGPTISGNENYAAFFEEGKGKDLIDLVQGGISAGYYFNNRFGARIALEYSNNHSALNYDETHAAGLFEYTFRSGAAFADLVLNGGNVKKTLMLDKYVPSLKLMSFFQVSAKPFDFKNPLCYLRTVSHVLGSSSPVVFLFGALGLLIQGPEAEKNYGTVLSSVMIVVSAVFTGVLATCFCKNPVSGLEPVLFLFVFRLVLELTIKIRILNT